MLLSIVIPAYNEESRIADTLRQLENYFRRQSYSSEIIVVDDGSSDQTAAIVREQFPNVQLISYQPNRGKGYAVREGMQKASGDIRVFYDADASTPIAEVEKLWPEFEAGANIVIGSRSLPGSDVQVHQAWHRQRMGVVFNRLVQVITRLPFRDTQCGFKAFTASAAGIVFPRQTIDRYSFDVELLYIAKLHGLCIKEIPVRWINSPHSRVRLVRDSWRTFVEILVIRARQASGRYR